MSSPLGIIPAATGPRQPTTPAISLRRFFEFLAATIRNKNTRMAYYHADCRFFASGDEHHTGTIADFEAMQNGLERPSVKQLVADVRVLFD